MKFTMKLFYPDGKPDGVVSIKKINASGDAIAFPRDLCAAVCRDENYDGIFKWPCVYVLWHPGGRQKPRVYVGESNRLAQRMPQHMQKEFWTRAVVYTDTNGDLHASQIEAQLVQCANDAKVCDLENTQKPRNFPQSDADAAATESHIYDLPRLFLPLAGCDFFRPRGDAFVQQAQPVKRIKNAAHVVPVAEVASNADLYLSEKDIRAKGRETGTGFLVYAGSQMSKKEAPALRKSRGLKHHASVRDDLKKQNLLTDDGNSYRFVRDYTFKSPSKAASVILGTSANGPALWKNAEGRTLGDIRSNPQDATAAPKLTASKPRTTPLAAVAEIFPSADLFLNAPKSGIRAKGRETDTGFLVYADSQVAKSESPSLRRPAYKSNIVIREYLKDNKLLADDGNVYRLSQNYLFTSSSAAATVILGTASSGLAKWKNAEGRALGELQKQKT